MLFLACTIYCFQQWCGGTLPNIWVKVFSSLKASFISVVFKQKIVVFWGQSHPLTPVDHWCSNEKQSKFLQKSCFGHLNLRMQYKLSSLESYKTGNFSKCKNVIKLQFNILQKNVNFSSWSKLLTGNSQFSG